MNKCVIVRGGGDIATGTIYKLVKSGFQVLVLEVEKPSATLGMICGGYNKVLFIPV